MALTATQIENIRRYVGAPASGTDIPTNDSSDVKYGFVSPGVWQTLYHRLQRLTPEAESIITTVFLANLTTLESAIVGASDNLDTAKAAVWEWNKNEVSDRVNLFNYWRKRLYEYLLGGDQINTSGPRIVRA